MSNCSGSISSINNASSNLNSINNFGDKYQVASSNPSTDGGGNALAAGDLYFNTSANELKVYTGSAWQGGVTATGNFAAVTGNTFTGNNNHNDNVKSIYGAGNDLEIFSDGNNSIIKENTSNGSLKILGQSILLKNTNDSEVFIDCHLNGNVELYHNNLKKIETTSTGATITGLMTATTIDGAAGDNLQLDFGTL